MVEGVLEPGMLGSDKESSKSLLRMVTPRYSRLIPATTRGKKRQEKNHSKNKKRRIPESHKESARQRREDLAPRKIGKIESKSTHTKTPAADEKGSARVSRAGERVPRSQTFLCANFSVRVNSIQSSFRRHTETSTPEACATLQRCNASTL